METLREPVEEARLEPRPQPPEPAYFDFSWFTTERVIRIVEIVVVVLATGFVLGQLGLGNILSDTTPAGGDMGAHVWGPAFLRDHLLNHGRLSGWTPDWYDGFPAYQFYMVLPALMIVVLNAGLHGWAGVAAARRGHRHFGLGLPSLSASLIASANARQPRRSSSRCSASGFRTAWPSRSSPFSAS